MNAAQEIYGEGRLKAELGVAANASPQELVSAVKLQVDAFSGGSAENRRRDHARAALAATVIVTKPHDHYG